MPTVQNILNISELATTIRLISSAQCNYYAEACAVALEKQGNSKGIRLKVSGIIETDYQLDWKTPENINGWTEPRKYVENGAVAISFLLTHELTDYEVFEEATIGTGVDYWLAYDDTNKLCDSDNFMEARLEISGINKESATNNIDTRLKQKTDQTNPTDSSGLPAYISIVEFATPKAYFKKK